MTSPNYFLAHIWLIPLFPLITAGLMLFFGRLLPKSAINFLCVGSVLLSFLYAAGAALTLFRLAPEQRIFQQLLFEWVTPGPIVATGGPIEFIADWGYLLDPLSCVMILVVTGVGFLIHVYSIGYMAHEGGYYRFFGYMNLFMFSMLTLVLANNLLLMFVGWEGVGLCSYLLIGFYFLRKSACDAGKKAFIVNRVGDTGFLLGIFLIAATFGTVRFTSHGLGDPVAFLGINETLGAMLSQDRLVIGGPLLTAIALLLFVGATGKSAQLPLYVWLPDAMEGPTPVSALIHAATMVTAGVYMVARMNAIYQVAPFAMDVVAVVGAVTAIFAATMALAQADIKKVLAYSTISQLGYMFLALGVGAFSAGIFHLMTHAFFKALLFLGAGSVIHALSGEQDLRKMGGLWNTIPATSRPFLIATLAIAGMPPLAGFFSKDEILGRAFARVATVDRYLFLWIVGVVTAGLTAFYMFRLLFLAFFGFSRVPPEKEHHIHESPSSMTIPLMILAALSIIGGWFALPSLWGGKSSFEEFLEPVVSGVIPLTSAVKFAHHTLLIEWFLMIISVTIAGMGIWFAYDFYIQHPQMHSKIAARWPRLHDLLVHKYYVDEIYDALFVNRIKDLSTAFGLFDAEVIDGFGVDGAAWLARVFSRISMWWDKWIVDGLVNLVGKFTRSLSQPVRMLQNGVFSSYALFIVIGLAILLAYYGHHMQVLARSVR
ncbi:MAG TPA: NADH-quinone oxidoreductase subunit L [Candidatus Eremiobacteraceae bacterium]|nr:NADH-quinone oxidoreductase subunit L [Candidatus Eremiobacteraceae bacterium]